MSEQTITCPNCSRQVEAGFKFCDYCGARLEAAAEATAATATSTDAPPEPKSDEPGGFRKLFGSRRERELDDATETIAATRAEPESEVPDLPPELPARPSAPVPPPLPEIEPPPPRTEPKPESPREVAEPAAPPPPAARFTSRPMKASEIQGGGPAIAGRVRWREGEAPPGPEDTTEFATAVSEPPGADEPGWTKVDTVRPAEKLSIPRFVVHLVLAFAAGAVLLGVAAVVASMTSNGSVALLEIRGLPILIAGSTAIVVFSLMRTGPRAQGDRRQRTISVAVGFLVIVAAVAFLYRPSLMIDAQKQLDRSLGIFGPDVEQGVERFTGDVDQWNVEVNNYRTDLTAVTQAQENEADPAKRDAANRAFSVAASGLEAALDGINKRMIAHAEAIEHEPLQDALGDLAAIFGDELAGIRLLTRGFVSNDQPMISSGDTRFKDSTTRAVELFNQRVEPLLERAEISPESLRAAVTELRGQ